MTALAMTGRTFAHARATPLVVVAMVVLGLAVALLALTLGLPWFAEGPRSPLIPGGPDLHPGLA